MFSLARHILKGLHREIRLMACQSKSFSEAVRPAQDLASDDGQDSSNIVLPDEAELRKKFQHELKDYSVEDFRHLIKDDMEEKKVHLILLELTNLRDNTHRAPSHIPEKDLSVLLKLGSRAQRIKYLDFMFKKEMAQLNDTVRKELRRLELASQPKKPTKMSKSIYPIIRDQQMTEFYNQRLATAALFGQKLIIDCGFEENMSHKELSSFFKQIQFSHASNKVSRDPFDMILSDIIEGGRIDKELSFYLPQLNSNECLLTKTYESYINLFPKERFLYLTPNSNNILRRWNHDDIVIIGGLVDKSETLPLTLGKARNQGIRHAKLPIGMYTKSFTLHSSQALNINTVADILLTMKTTKDWTKAFEHIPPRLVANNERRPPLTNQRVDSSVSRRKQEYNQNIR